ncbi:DUF1648 domain-containing protein [Lacticaseibacillus zhaodongensis]|uniref:DUF1648 domain-containing protein n=1 Tax=Lacticaseibacillus zhaodongensis TaxID=2668065 RepID=UPI0012D34D6D|nr:DUF1648 domain-containing protein [Lacticaseibacillus zhaodongensis]
MSKSKWHTLILTSLVTIAPILYGASVYSRLPARMVTHWSINNQPNGWMARPMVVFGLPLLMLLFQLITVGSTYYAESKQPHAMGRMGRVVAWIFPVISVVMYAVTIRAGVGNNVNIRFWALLIVALILILIGNYMPTVQETNSRYVGMRFPWHVTNHSGARKTARALGYLYVLSGAIVLVSLLFPPMVSAICIGLFILANFLVLSFSYRWTTGA